MKASFSVLFACTGPTHFLDSSTTPVQTAFRWSTGYQCFSGLHYTHTCICVASKALELLEAVHIVLIKGRYSQGGGCH